MNEMTFLSWCFYKWEWISFIKKIIYSVRKVTCVREYGFICCIYTNFKGECQLVYTLGKCHFVKPRRNWCNLFIIIQFVSHKYIMVDKSIWGAASHACVVVHVLRSCNKGWWLGLGLIVWINGLEWSLTLFFSPKKKKNLEWTLVFSIQIILGFIFSFLFLAI